MGVLSIRDSVEPEDSMEDELPNDILLLKSPPVDFSLASPITFDIPSTTSGETTSSNTCKSSKRARSVGLDRSRDGIWDVQFDSPDVARAVDEDTPTGKKKTRRHSMVTIPDLSTTRSTRSNSRLVEESPTITRKRRVVINIDDEEELNAEGDSTLNEDIQGTLSEEIEVAKEKSDLTRNQDVENLIVETSPRKLIMAVEIPRRKRKAQSTVLEEIDVANIPAPEIKPKVQRQRIRDPPLPQPESEDSKPEPEPEPDTNDNLQHDSEDVESAQTVRCAKPAPSEPRQTTLSPSHHKNVSMILNKSPHRPIYRVGLSRRVQIESLHSYLKKTA
jgi:hypothetical protein